MPYRDRQQQLEAMREWRKRRAERESAQRSEHRGESWRTSEPHKLTREGSIPSPATTSANTSANTSPSPTTGSPRSPTERTRASGRRQLLKQYTDLRAGGLSDTQAQGQLTQQRETQQRQAQIDQHEREIRRLAPQFVAPARRHLSMAGCYVEADVMPLAHHMAERSLVLAQPVRQGDVVRQLPPPRLPALPPPQPALPIWQGVRRPATTARMALGAEQRVLPEEARAAIQEAIVSLARRGRL